VIYTQEVAAALTESMYVEDEKDNTSFKRRYFENEKKGGRITLQSSSEKRVLRVWIIRNYIRVDALIRFHIRRPETLNSVTRELLFRK
jgi:hypothetical protein